MTGTTILRVPTPDEIREYRQWRGRMINAIWDAEAADTSGWPAIDIRGTVQTIGAQDLPQHAVARLVNDLVGDGLLEPFGQTAEATYPLQVKLTSFGRLEVERWISDDQPTEHLALPPSQVFNTHFHGDVSGSAVVVGSKETIVNLQAVVGDSLSELVVKTKDLLAAWQGDDDEREEIVADVELLETESSNQSAPVGHVKAALRRITRWAAGASAVGASAALSGEVQQLAGTVLQHL